jgi:hypothetical protein
MPDDLDDKVREGIIELQLDSEKSHKQYLRMTLKRILDCVDMKYLTMIVFTDEDQVAMKPYTKEVVEAFTLKLCE